MQTTETEHPPQHKLQVVRGPAHHLTSDQLAEAGYLLAEQGVPALDSDGACVYYAPKTGHRCILGMAFHIAGVADSAMVDWGNAALGVLAQAAHDNAKGTGTKFRADLLDSLISRADRTCNPKEAAICRAFAAGVSKYMVEHNERNPTQE